MASFRRIAELEREGVRAAVVTVVRTTGSTPRSAGARMLVFPDGRIEGSIGGGKIEHSAQEAAKEVLERGEAQLLDFKLTQELGMCCGGQATVFIEPLGKHSVLIVFGAGHVGAALARGAVAAGFAVHVADERPELLDAARFPPEVRRYEILDDPELPFGPDAYVMITTHDHGLDQRLLERCLRMPHRWVGVIGSRRKASLTRKRLLHRGFEPALVESVRIPVGLAIGAETPEEIAVSILGELIAVKRGTSLQAEDGALLPHLETKSRSPSPASEAQGPLRPPAFADTPDALPVGAPGDPTRPGSSPGDEGQRRGPTRVVREASGAGSGIGSRPSSPLQEVVPVAGPLETE